MWQQKFTQCYFYSENDFYQRKVIYFLKLMQNYYSQKTFTDSTKSLPKQKKALNLARFESVEN